jgi:outer membrane protein
MRSAAIVLCLAVAAGPAFAQSPVLSLDDAIANAVEHNRSLQNAALAEERAAHDVGIARTRRLPIFNVEAQASQLLRPVDITFRQGTFGSFPGTGPIPATDTQITTPARATFLFDARVAQPLTQLKQAGLNIRLAESTLQFEREETRAARLALVNQVKRAYYRVLQASSALTAAESSSRLLQEVNRVVGNRVVQQVALRGDALDVEARLADIELTILTLRHSLDSGKEQLNQLMGRDVRTAFDVAGVPPTPAIERDLEAVRARAVAERPDVRQARLQVEQAQLSQKVARADYLPEVSVAVESFSPLNVDGAPRTINTVGVQLTWEPFDWGRKARTVASRALQVRQAENALRDVEDRAVIEINGRYRTLAEARARLRVASLSQETAGENARVRATQFQVQAALLSDVLQSQAALADANNQYQQALLSLLTASADFEQSLGQDGVR